MSTQLYENTVKALGGDTSTLPDGLKTTYLDAMCRALGIDTSGMTDTLESSFYQLIIDNYTGGSGGTGGSGDAPLLTASGSFTTIEECFKYQVHIPNISNPVLSVLFKSPSNKYPCNFVDMVGLNTCGFYMCLSKHFDIATDVNGFSAKYDTIGGATVKYATTAYSFGSAISPPFSQISNGIMTMGSGMSSNYFKFEAGATYYWIVVGE